MALELITDAETIRYTHLQNAAAWRSRLTAEEYADREWHIGCGSKVGQRDYARHTGLYHFAFRVDGVIVASCETLNRKGWRARDGELVEVVVPCIGGVFTLAEHRGNGHAAEMIKQLNAYWDERLDNRGFMILYSEVGDYYAKFGYASHEVKVHDLHITDSLPSAQYDHVPLGYEQYHDLVDIQYNRIKAHLIENSQGKTLFSMIPTIDIYSWFHDRDLFIAERLNKPTPTKFGASLSTNEKIVWLHDWNESYLTIVEVSWDTPESFNKLFQLAINEARDCGMKGIHAWHSSVGENVSWLKALGAELYRENGSRSALRALDGSEDCEWAFNDKWCWF